MTQYQAPKALRQAQRLANLTDTAITLPIVGIKLGLDFLLGLIPAVGDALMFLLSWRIIHLAKKIGMPKGLRTMMWRNAMLDFVLGLVPVVGDIVDLFYKANRANVAIMERWWLEQNKAQLARHTEQVLQQWQQAE